MKQSKTPLWKKSMLQNMNYEKITDMLYEILENGDPYGYSSDEDGYYQEYKDQFDDLSAGAYMLLETLNDLESYGELCCMRDYWDDMTVALLGETQKVLGFNVVEQDYFGMLSPYQENLAVEEAMKRIERYTKRDLILYFKNILVTLISFMDIKAAHDCLTSIVEELDDRAAIMENGNMPQRGYIE